MITALKRPRELSYKKSSQKHVILSLPLSSSVRIWLVVHLAEVHI